MILAALVSSTLLNCVFPFFTYLPSSGLLGEQLPQVISRLRQHVQLHVCVRVVLQGDFSARGICRF